MLRWGYCPSVRLFEAAACGVAVISDYWDGLETLFRPDQEILISSSAADTLLYLQQLSDSERQRIGQAARAVVMERHTADCPAAELETFFQQAHAAREASPAAAQSAQYTTGPCA